jgi:hypothetical protein
MPQTPVPAPVTITPSETLDAAIAPKSAARAAIIAQKGEGNLITTLLQAVKSVLPQSTAIKIPSNDLTGTPKATIQGTTIAPAAALPVITQPLILSAKIISLTLPSGQTIAIPQTTTPAPVQVAMPTPVATAPPLITATVTEVTAQNQPIIPIPTNNTGGVQNFILQSPPATVPVGTQVTLMPQLSAPPLIVTGDPSMISTPSASAPIAAPASILPPAWRGLLPLMQSSSVWPVMDELFQTFYQTTPQAAQIFGRTIPSPANPSNFGPTIMLFAAALKSGDLQGWLGEKKLEMIQKLGKQSILSRLSGETASLSTNNDAASTEWKSFPIPLLWQNEISKLMFHVRKEPSENEQDNPEGGSRFVMDLSLTRMGEVQLDGMVRGKRLDLIVRTQLPISPIMQDAMYTAYSRALDGTDIYGEIGFQSDVKNWENIIKREENLAASV